jgi:soluble lytic murein transglycosylase-like protein
MGALTRLVPALVLFAATPAHADEVGRWRPLIAEASSRFGVPTSWIERVIRAESRGFTTLNGRPIRSRAGAMGLMQLMPATWADMRARLALGSNPDDPRDNILAGTFFLRLMYDRFGYPGLFGAYNAGPGAYASYLAGKRRLPGETVAYLGSVSGSPPAAPQSADIASKSLLFVVRRDVASDRPGPEGAGAQAMLFVVRKVGP